MVLRWVQVRQIGLAATLLAENKTLPSRTRLITGRVLVYDPLTDDGWKTCHLHLG